MDIQFEQSSLKTSAKLFAELKRVITDSAK